MKKFLAAGTAALLALYFVASARAQDDPYPPDYTYPTVDLRDPSDPAQWVSWVVNDMLFPVLPDQGVTTADVLPLWQPGLFDGCESTGTVSGVTFGPEYTGTGTFTGDVGVSYLRFISEPTGSHRAHLRVTTIASGDMVPMVALHGAVVMHVIPMLQVFNPATNTFGPPPPSYSVWFGCGFPTGGLDFLPRGTYTFDVSVVVPPGSLVVSCYFAHAVGLTLADAICPGVGASIFIP